MKKDIVLRFIPALTFIFLFQVPVDLYADDVNLTILHTSDIHGHFTNEDSPIRLGGIARLKTKIDFLKKQNDNNLLLDSGDWSEGTIFYTLNSGEANHRMMEAMGYDAIVLGNHEWLVGPKDLYEAFDAAKFQIPVLSANLGFGKLPPEINLSKYIKPYVIKEVGGKRIGILGLSTFEIIFDNFFEPTQIKGPIQVALKYIKKMREEENCDVVIVLSHLGIQMDKNLAQSVPGIDMIVGGHTHLLLKEPVYVKGVPIVHVGQWAQYLGEYNLTIHEGADGRNHVRLLNHKIHQIDFSTPEDPYIKGLVEGFKAQVEALRGGSIFNDKIFSSQVNLPIGASLTEDIVGNWAVDAIRGVGKTVFAMDIGQYFRRDLFAGTSSTVDFYNIFPHIYNKIKKKSWTIYTAEVKGQTIEKLIHILSKIGLGVRVSNASYEIDGDEALNSVKNFKVNQQKINLGSYYKISLTEGVLQALDGVKSVGFDMGVRGVRDTGVEAWRAIKDHIVAKSPITVSKVSWEGRVRTTQPDIYIPLEQVLAFKTDDQTVSVRYKVINAGLKKVLLPNLAVRINPTPLNSLNDNWLSMEEASPSVPTYLNPGQAIEKTVFFRQNFWGKGYYPVEVESSIDAQEFNKSNNKVMGYFAL